MSRSLSQTPRRQNHPRGGAWPCDSVDLAFSHLHVIFLSPLLSSACIKQTAKLSFSSACKLLLPSTLVSLAQTNFYKSSLQMWLFLTSTTYTAGTAGLLQRDQAGNNVQTHEDWKFPFHFHISASLKIQGASEASDFVHVSTMMQSFCKLCPCL